MPLSGRTAFEALPQSITGSLQATRCYCNGADLRRGDHWLVALHDGHRPLDGAVKCVLVDRVVERHSYPPCRRAFRRRSSMLRLTCPAQCPKALDRIERRGVAQHRRVLARGQLRLRICSRLGKAQRHNLGRGGSRPRQWFHDRSHAYATLMLEDGEALAVISRSLGHATHLDHRGRVRAPDPRDAGAFGGAHGRDPRAAERSDRLARCGVWRGVRDESRPPADRPSGVISCVDSW